MSTSNVEKRWTLLTNFSSTIEQLTAQRWAQELGHLFEHVNGLQAKMEEQQATIRSQDETMQARSNEMIRAAKEHKDRLEEVIESHTNLIRRRDEEKAVLKQALSRQEKELNEAKTSTQQLQQRVQTLQNQLEGQDAEAKKIVAQLHGARMEVEKLQQMTAEHKEQIKSREHQRQVEKKAHVQLKSQMDALGQRHTNLEAQLRASDDKLKYIDGLALPLMEDHPAEVSKSVRNVWKSCFQLAQACYRDANPLEQLQNPASWRELQTSNLITHTVPLPPTNSDTARRMRLVATLAILTNSLTHHLFCSTFLLDRTEGLDRLVLEMADINHDREALFRRLLNAVSTSIEEQLTTERTRQIIDEVIRCIEPLLSVDQGQKMKSDLADLVEVAADLWRSLQKRRSYFAVEPQAPSATQSTWKSLVWKEDKKTFIEEDSVAPQDAVFMLFPRVIMLNHEGEQEIFPGVVLRKSETTAAHTELGELIPSSPSLMRSDTHRSNGGRRRTTDRRPGSASFLAQSGSSKSSAP